jgi:hypothetical protein
LRDTPDRLDKDFRRELRNIANEVRDDARARAAAQGRPQHVINAISAGADSARPWVKLGRAGVPDAMGWEFGAYHNQPRRRATGEYRGFNQFPLWTGNQINAGTFLWPAIRQGRERVVMRVANAIDTVLEEAPSEG